MFDSVHVFEPLLDSEQAAALMKIHPKTLQRYARAGLVAGLRVGKLWRFRASDLDRCLPHGLSSEQLSVPSHHP
jgi:excisionase family DNA binding protein